MTGPIILSSEDSKRIRNNILIPDTEYIEERKQYFDKLSKNITIYRDNTDTIVEFNDLDLSDMNNLIN